LTLPVAAQETRTVETPKGAVSLPTNPERIIVLNPQLAGSVYALGFDVMGVARTSRGATDEGFAAAWADIAREAGSEVVEWDFEGFNFEMLLSYEPDLIIAGGAGRPGYLANDSYEMLSDIAPTLFVDTALPNWQAELDYLAETLDRNTEEQAALDAYAIRIAEVRGP
jgi:iron complex transport system substrate-binding protein